ncbi:tetratricopeptide repeat protein [Chryseobacterium joostei]|uniref:tetratricopeptide repeat protein n=1 Tax=Chryseobacterium joostei TaxID=112234 RepID=UPI0013DE472F|nr:tetratricopeptide repeat protein [Chryseobacterium joostei]
MLDSSYVKQKEVKLQESFRYAKVALDLSKEKEYSEGIAWGNFYIAQSLSGLNAYKQALEYLDKAQIENQKLNDYYLHYQIRRIRGRIYMATNLLLNAIIEFKRAAEIIPRIKKQESDIDLANALIHENLGLAYGFMKKPDSAYYYLNECRIILQKIELKKSLSHIINNYTELADYYTSVGKITEAEYYIRKAVTLAKNSKFPFLSFAYTKYGDLLLQKKKNDSALIYYQKALAISRQKIELIPLYQKIAYIYHLSGNISSEEKYKLKFLELQDSYNSEMLSASNLAINTILSEQKEELVQKNKKRQSYLLLISAVILLLLLGLWLLFVRKTKKLNHIKKISSEKEQMLIQQKEEITLRYEEDTKNLEQRVNESFDEVVQLAKNNSPEFFTRFREVYPEVIVALLAIDPKLRVSELSLCAYFFLGFRTKDISIYTFKSLSTIRNRRQNLRKKLEILPDEDLELWFKKLVNKNN